MIKENITIENVRIGFRNFSGKEGKFNPEGRRNFCVFLESDIGKELERDGWNVRWLDPREEGDERQAYLQVAVSYDKFAPRIVLVSSRGKSLLTEETVNILDWAEIKFVDLTIRPYNWDANGKTGVKAYIKSMFVTIYEDELDQKYYDVPDSATDSVGGCGHCETCDGHCGHNAD